MYSYSMPTQALLASLYKVDCILPKISTNLLLHHISGQAMDLHAVLLVLFLCSLLVGHNGVGGSSLSKEEDLKLEKQLKLLNKPAVKTIHTDYGDIYDCVDFYKQPAFDHPLLKNHTFHFQMKPANSLHESTRVHISSKVSKPQLIGSLKGLGCPVGTVPIRRITKEDLIRERLASKIMPLGGDNKPGAFYATVQTKDNPNKQYYAAGGTLSVYNPEATGTQYSAARVKVQNGPDSIEAGWRVDPTLYGDNRTRFYIRIDAVQSQCFNTLCPGFVIVNSKFPIDFVFNDVSKRGGPFTEVTLFLIRDNNNGNWYLEVGDKRVQIGFWPASLLSGLAEMASSAEWGGEVFGPPGTTPAMGSGSVPIGDTRYDGYIYNIAVSDERGQNVDPDTQVAANNALLYDIRDEGNTKSEFGHLVLYGGPATS